MEGIIFYWICWLFWIYFTFILDKQNPYRLKLSAIVLIVLLLSNIYFMVGGYKIHTSALFLLVISYLFFAKEKRRAIIFIFICSFIISIAYVTFHLFVIFDPAWIIIKKEWMMGLCFGFLSILLQKPLKGRLIVFVSGAIQGEILFAYILSGFQITYPIGAFAFLDVCSITATLLVGWSCLENASVFVQNHFHFFEKGKQKSS
ncbi:MAG: hypothetical protein K6T88_06590 [Bacillus sp. (in: Bacteria)]|nr:hypothetical protein [Bacillus sp. (in: firmicutes)]